MFFSSKPTTILYLRQQDAVLITKNTSVKLEIPADVVQNQELLDAAKLTDLVASFLDRHKCKGQQMMLMLDIGIVFQKAIPAKDTTALNDFVAKIPFEPEHIQFITATAQNQKIIFGVNQSYYQAVAQGIRRANKLRGIVPAAAYGVAEGKKIDRRMVGTFFNDPAPLRHTNFMAKK